MLQEHFAVIDAEDASVADFATFAGGKQLDDAPTSVKVIAKRYDVMQVENRAVGFPNGNIDRVAAIKHSASGGYVYRASQQEKTTL